MTLKKIEDRPTPPAVYNIRVWSLAILAAWGAFLFGYDSAFIGGTISLPAFQATFGLDAAHATNAERAFLSANIVSTYQGGAFFGSLLAFPIAERFGRRITLITAAATFTLGAGIMLAATSSTGLGPLYAGRVIGGLGVGAVSLVVPLYIAEIAPPAIRGQLGGLYEVILQVGGLLGFWINYGVSTTMSPSTKQWHIPIGLQIIPGGLLLIGSFFLTESPRWLRLHGQEERSIKTLAWIRKLDEDDKYILEEIEMIDRQLATVRDYTLRRQFSEIFRKGIRNRLVAGLLMMMFQNLTGVNAINYYSTTIFNEIGVTGTNAGLFGTGIYGVVKTIATLVWLVWLIDNIGRRHLLIWGSAFAIFSMFYIGAYVQIANPQPGASITSGGISAAAFLYIYAIFYSMSWNGTSWVFISEIYPNHVRTLLISISAANQWLWQFVVARSTPYMITNLRGGTFFFFGGCTVFALLWAVFLIPETKGVSLEGMDKLFGYNQSPDVEGRSSSNGSMLDNGIKEEKAPVDASAVQHLEI